MKKHFLFLLVFISAAFLVHAQAPNAIPYQGVARNAAGNILVSQPISLRISIHDGTAAGTVVFSETHAVSTNTLGLFNVNIGSGTTITGSLAGINWGNGAKFIQVELDLAGGNAYADMGTTQLNSVPYALYAGKAGSGNFVDLTTNQIIAGSKTFSGDAFMNGVRVGRGTGDQYSTAVGNGALNGSGGSYNTGMGWGALHGNSGGSANAAFGMSALYSTTTGGSNTAIGYRSLLFNVTGGENSALGANAGIITSGSDNTFIGASAGSSNTTGSNNTTLGANTQVGATLTNATAIGANATATVSNTLILGNNANIGIGTTTPSAKLEVAGNVKIVDGTQGAGKVLTSDANGLASWVATATAHYIGESYGGGIVFYVYDNGLHGLIAAANDLPSVSWYNGINKYCGASGNGIGSGMMNTVIIISAQAADIPGGNFAAKACADYSVIVNGVEYGDWYLPSSTELMLLFNQKNIVGNFGTYYYWSSKEVNIDDGYPINFTTGSFHPLYASKYNQYPVRPIRSF